MRSLILFIALFCSSQLIAQSINYSGKNDSIDYIYFFFNSDYSLIENFDDGSFALAYNAFNPRPIEFVFIEPIGVRIFNSAEFNLLDHGVNNNRSFGSGASMERIEQIVKINDNNYFAVVELFHCDYWDYEAIFFDSLGQVTNRENLSEIPKELIKIDIGIIELSKYGWIRRFTNTMSYEGFIDIGGGYATDILVYSDTSFLIGTKQSIYHYHNDGTLLGMYNIGSLHLSYIDDQIIAYGDSTVQILDADFQHLATKPHSITINEKTTFQQVLNHTYVYEPLTIASSIYQFDGQGELTNMLTLSRWSKITDIGRIDSTVVYVGADVNGKDELLWFEHSFGLVKASTTATVKSLEFDTINTTNIDLAITGIKIEGDTSTLFTDIEHIELEVTNHGTVPIKYFTIRDMYSIPTNDYCPYYGILYEHVYLLDEPLLPNQTYIHVMTEWGNSHEYNAADGSYSICLWVASVNNSQDMVPENDYYCETFLLKPTSTETPITPQISISPNPTQNHFQIDLETPPSETTQVRIFNTNGQLLQIHSINKQSTGFSTSDFVSGTYFIQVQQGEQVYNERLVILK